jgi:16S rRNA (guanine527-N7)-methyltransferase
MATYATLAMRATTTRVARCKTIADGCAAAMGASRASVVEEHARVIRRLSCRATSSSSSSSSSYDAKSASLTERQREKMTMYAALVMRENRGEHGMLTGATSEREVLEEHASDALALLDVFDGLMRDRVNDVNDEGGDGVRVMDVGSGAGFPGIPLAIARPEWRFTLLDTLRKRTSFLEVVVRELGLTNVTVVWGRAEDSAKEAEHRESYDIVTARAVAEMRVLAEFCLPFAANGGYWVSAKNAEVEAETRDSLKAIATLGGGDLRVESVDSIGPDGRPRTAVVCPKIAPTPEKYPRRAGMAKKRPL